MKQTVFFISDQTGLTSELLGQTLLSQFDSIEFVTQTLPYVDNEKKALEVVELINRNAQENDLRPILFSTLVQPEIKAILHNSQALMLDVFEHFIAPLEQEFKRHSSHRVGKKHTCEDKKAYDYRIQAVNYALNTDDGLSIKQYAKADIILLGVSRSGKTPTALYLAMQFGIMAANYPITEEDLENHELPTWALQFKDKLFGLEIDADRLQEIRTDRRPNSRYASQEQCVFEVKQIKKLYNSEVISTINTTNRSIEEIATKVIERTKLKR
ncbi:MAG: kinase/pyrophosphorylase [Gammaproteobacteria bacterium]|nr:kinase/pyrophosphorylase [Gammaproteobacteria bacterium]